MAIRLAALDVDGTLLAPDNSITPATRQAIREAKDAGLEIVVCTGRSFVEVQDILRQLPEVRYLSCGTGAYALDVWTMEMLYECSMPSELGKAAYRAVAQADCMVHFYTGLSVRHSRWCMDHFSDYMEEKMRPLMEKTHIIEDDLDAYVENSHDPVYKLYVTFPRKEEYDKAYNAVKDLPVFLTDGGWAIDLEVMSRDTDKGVALKALAERLGISLVTLREALLMLALWRAAAHERAAAVRTALMLLPIGVGLLISVIAPGNSVRMAADGAHESGLGYLLASIGWTLRDAVKYILRFMLKTPLLALLLLALPAASRRMNERGETGEGLPRIGFTLLGGYLMLCAMIIPHMYSSGYAGSGRVINMYHSYVLLFAPVVCMMALARVRPEKRAALAAGRGKIACFALAAAALAVCLCGGQLRNYEKLVSDQLDGTQDAYIAQFQHEYALCEAAGAADDVVLPAWTVQTVTGKPTAYEDAAFWTNEAMAQYFGVKSVRVE